MKAAKRHVTTYTSLAGYQYEYEKDVKSTASQLLDAIQSVGKPLKPTDIHIVIYFDEAHPLHDLLRSVMSLLADFPFFGIMVSTKPNLVMPAPPIERVHPSQRVVITTEHLQAPFTELPFDCLENDEPIFCLGKTLVEEVSTLAFMVKFGRPL